MTEDERACQKIDQAAVDLGQAICAGASTPLGALRMMEQAFNLVYLRVRLGLGDRKFDQAEPTLKDQLAAFGIEPPLRLRKDR